MKKQIILLLTVIILPMQAFAMVNFNIEGMAYFNSLKVEDNLMLIESKNKDFIFVYNNSNEVIYVKHKNLMPTFKIPFLKLRNSKFLTNIRPENTELVLENFKSDLYTVDFAGRDCLQFYTAKDLQLGSSVSSVFALYKAFVYLTGQRQVYPACKNFNIATSLDASLGLPMAIFYKEKQFKLINMSNGDIKMKKYLSLKNINTKKAISPNLNLQYELMYSLLSDEQQNLAQTQIKNKSIAVKIKTIQNLLAGF